MVIPIPVFYSLNDAPAWFPWVLFGVMFLACIFMAISLWKMK